MPEFKTGLTFSDSEEKSRKFVRIVVGRRSVVCPRSLAHPTPNLCVREEKIEMRKNKVRKIYCFKKYMIMMTEGILQTNFQVNRI